MIFSLSFRTLTPPPSARWAYETLHPYFWLIIYDFYFFLLSVYTQIYFKNTHIFQMTNFNWLLRTKLIIRIIKLLIVAIFPWHNIWRGSISDVLFQVLNVANGRSPRFLLPLPLTSNLRALALAVSSDWSVLPWLAFSHSSSPLECHSTEKFSLRVLFKVLTLSFLVRLHHVVLLYFLYSRVSLSEVLISELPYWGQQSRASSHTKSLCPKTQNSTRHLVAINKQMFIQWLIGSLNE